MLMLGTLFDVGDECVTIHDRHFQVDEHDVLRAFLGIGQQVPGVLVVLLLGRPAAARAGDRTDFDLAVDRANVDFGRTADQRKSPARAG